MPVPYIAQQNVDDFGLMFSDAKSSVSIAGLTDTTLTVPGAAKRYKAVMKAETDAVVWVSNNQTAAIPSGATFASVSSEMIPVNGVLCREVKAGDVLHFITEYAGADISVTFYSFSGTNGI